MCNPGLSEVITDRIGEDWVVDLSQLRQLGAMEEDVALLKDFDRVKQVCVSLYTVNIFVVSKISFERSPSKVLGRS